VHFGTIYCLLYPFFPFSTTAFLKSLVVLPETPSKLLEQKCGLVRLTQSAYHLWIRKKIVSRSLVLLLLPVMIVLAACGGAAPEVAETSPAPTVTLTATPPPPAAEPTATVEPTVTPTSAPTAAPLSYQAQTFRYQAAGFEMDIPADWTVPEPMVVGDRGTVVQLTDAASPRLDVSLLQWDPRRDLAAFIETRRTAWEASDISILSEKKLTLSGGLPAVRFVVQSATGEQAFFLFTTAGERYLQLSGSGDLALLAEISQTLRPIQSAAEALNCAQLSEATVEWVACNVMDGIRSRNLSALHTFMSDPFTIGYWGSEGRSAAPAEVTAELMTSRLPADPATPLSFTSDRSQFPPLAGQPPETFFGPDVNIVMVIYSQGWGTDGKGAALLFFAQDEAGSYTWHSMIYSDRDFDR